MSFERHEAYLIRRLLTGQSLNGDAGRLSERLRPLGCYLEGLEPDARPGAFAAAGPLLFSDDEAAAFHRAMAEVGEGDALPARPPYKLTCTANIDVQEVEWLWPGRVPLGMLSLFAGEPKLGKSCLTLALAASVSRGAPLPHEPGSDYDPIQGSVVLMSAEDDPSRVIVPRLIAAGAERRRIHILESVYLPRDEHDDKPPLEAIPSLAGDIERIEAAAASLRDCRLIIVDPVSAYLGGCDDHKNSELRGLLSPLKAAAERLGAAVVLVTHLNKNTSASGKNRVTGSIAYVGACRANFLSARDRDDDSGRRVLFLDNGGNIAPNNPPWPTGSRTAATAPPSSGKLDGCRFPRRRPSPARVTIWAVSSCSRNANARTGFGTFSRRAR